MLAIASVVVIGPVAPSGSVRVRADLEPLGLSSTAVDGIGEGARAHPFPPIGESRPSQAFRGGSDRWPATFAVVLAMVLLGAVALASRRLRPAMASGTLQVVGRAALSPKQAVYLLRVGDRVLIVGAGTQGPPALLGEINDSAERQRLLPRRDRPEGAGLTLNESPGSAERIGGVA